MALSPACSSEDSTENDGSNAEDDAGHNDVADPSTLCTAGERRCDGSDNIETCSEDGMSWEGEACPAGEQCDADQQACTEQVCTAGVFDGCTEEGLVRHCNASGTGWTEDSCPDGGVCEQGGCTQVECQSGVTRCFGPEQYETCSEAGVYAPSGTCPVGTECFDGQCEELCEISRKVSTYIGCEYWSVDLDNYGGALDEPHAIIITNYNNDLAAEVQLFEGYSDRRILVGADGVEFDSTIPPGQARIFELQQGYRHSGTRIFDDRAIRINSSIPVVAHQFNPLNNVGVYTNDGTVLIPTNSVGTEYWGLSWVNRSDSVNLRGYLTMVNSSTVANEVTVRPTAQVVAGPEISTMEAGEERTFLLEPGQSLNLVASGVELGDAQSHGCLSDPEGTPEEVHPCPDLTGTHITAQHPITVFGGHQCANVLLGVDRCDHIESVLFPVDSWSTEYVGTKFEPRADGIPEPDIWRVIAAEEGTRIQTDPPIEGIHGARLDAGEWRQFASRTDFVLAADAPVQLMQYMVGANWPGIPRVCDQGADAFNPTGIGDPAMAMAVPVEQFRDNYIVHTPQNYEEDYLNLIVPVGQDVMLNGESVPAERWEVVGEMNRFEVATLEVDAGFHTLTSEVPFGVVGYGYDCHVSYAYPGGLDLEPVASETPADPR